MEQLPGTGNSQIELDFDNKYDREEIKCEHEEWAMRILPNRSVTPWLTLIVDEAHEEYICARVKCEHCDEKGWYTIYAAAIASKIEWD